MNERLPVEFTPRAEAHVEQEGRWWRDNRSKAPDALSEDLADALDLIATQPQVGALARNVRLRNVRRVYLQRTGHYLYYRVQGGRLPRIQVVAFWHSSRRSGPPI